MKRETDVRQRGHKLQLTVGSLSLINGFSARSSTGPSAKQKVGRQICTYILTCTYEINSKIVQENFFFCREKQLSSIINIMGNTASVSKVGHAI